MGSLIKLGKKYFFEFSILSIILIWSSNNAVMKIGIEEIGPFIYNALRLTIAALLCWLWLYKTHTYRKMPWSDLKYLILIMVTIIDKSRIIMYNTDIQETKC